MTLLVTCDRCGYTVRRLRQAQRYCSTRCRMADAYHRRRRSVDKSPDVSPQGRSVDEAPSLTETGLASYVWPTPSRGLEEPKLLGATPGALQGDDYPLEYYEDGYPKLPACLDRRKNLEKEKFLDGLRRQAMPAAPNKLRSVDWGAE